MNILEKKYKIEKLLSIKQLLEIFGVSRSTLNKMRKEKYFPKPILFSKRILRWSPKEILRYINRRKYI